MADASPAVGVGGLVAVGVVALVLVGSFTGGDPLDDASARLDAPLPVAAAAVSPDPVRQQMGSSSIAIPALGVSARIGGAELEDGVLTPPLDPVVVGAWGGSADLGAATGEVTLAGHVSYGDRGPFAFGRLSELAPGELVYTTDAAGAQTAWRIGSVVARPKEAGVDVAAFDGADGARELSLITCGGSFDESASSYDANVYVSATPVPLPA